jgi:hypothetical protein
MTSRCDVTGIMVIGFGESSPNGSMITAIFRLVNSYNSPFWLVYFLSVRELSTYNLVN